MGSSAEQAFEGLLMLDRLEELPGPQRDALATVFGLAAGLAPNPLLVGVALLSLLSDVASARTPLLRCSTSARTDSSSLCKSARRSRLFSLDALAASATMSCQDRPGLALVYDMAR